MGASERCSRAEQNEKQNEQTNTPCGTQTHSLQIRSLTRYSIAPTGRLLLNPFGLLCEAGPSRCEMVTRNSVTSSPRTPSKKIKSLQKIKSLGPAGT